MWELHGETTSDGATPSDEDWPGSGWEGSGGSPETCSLSYAVSGCTDFHHLPHFRVLGIPQIFTEPPLGSHHDTDQRLYLEPESLLYSD